MATAAGDCQAGTLARGLPRLDDPQVRRWVSWYRWTTLAMLAIAFLTIAAAEHARTPAPLQLIPLAGIMAAVVRLVSGRR